MATPSAGAPASRDLQQQAAKAGSWLETTLFNFLQWYTSFFYWGAGLAVGLSAGWFYAVRTYVSTVIYDLFHFSERRAPAAVKEAKVAPPPAAVPAATRAAAAKAAEAARVAAAGMAAPAAAGPPPEPPIAARTVTTGGAPHFRPT